MPAEEHDHVHPLALVPRRAMKGYDSDSQTLQPIRLPVPTGLEERQGQTA